MVGFPSPSLLNRYVLRKIEADSVNCQMLLGYPEVAQLNGAILPVAGTNGQLEMVILKDISKLQRSVWVADHIYELALFVDFLSSGPQYSFLIQDVFHDPSVSWLQKAT